MTDVTVEDLLEAQGRCGKPFMDIWMDSWELCHRLWGHTGACDK